jgi:hypothetical protein
MVLVEPTGDSVLWTARCPCGAADALWRAERLVVLERGYSYSRVDYDIGCGCAGAEGVAA